MIVYSFLYNGCIHESSYATMSLHRTKKGAMDALKKHKLERMKKHSEYIARMEADLDKKGYSKKDKLTFMKSLSKFGAHEDWAVEEV